MLNVTTERVHMLWECQGVTLHLYLKGWERHLGRGGAKMKDKQGLWQNWELG